MRADFDAGRLDRRVLIERPVRTSNDYGRGDISSWAAVGECWAEKVDQLLYNNGEAANSDVRQRQILSRFRIRYRNDITTDMRLTEGRAHLGGGYSFEPANAMQIISISELGRADGIEMMAQNFSTAGA